MRYLHFLPPLSSASPGVSLLPRTVPLLFPSMDLVAFSGQDCNLMALREVCAQSQLSGPTVGSLRIRVRTVEEGMKQEGKQNSGTRKESTFK